MSMKEISDESNEHMVNFNAFKEGGFFLLLCICTCASPFHLI